MFLIRLKGKFYKIVMRLKSSSIGVLSIVDNTRMIIDCIGLNVYNSKAVRVMI